MEEAELRIENSSIEDMKQVLTFDNFFIFFSLFWSVAAILVESTTAVLVLSTERSIIYVVGSRGPRLAHRIPSVLRSLI
jgi:hypothetical protein